jgi:hypothetical protein
VAVVQCGSLLSERSEKIAPHPLPPHAAIPLGALNALVTVGVFLMVLSILGCVGVRFNYKVGGRYVLGAYAFLMVLVMLMEFSAFISLYVFTGKMDDFEAGNKFKDQGVYYMVNQTYTVCCNAGLRNPNRTLNGCWLTDDLPYPCDSIMTFKTFLSAYVDARIEPVAIVALVLCLLQLFTAVIACCNQCGGRKAEEGKKIGGPLSYDGLYSEGEETYSGYGYENYVKTGAARPGAPGPGAPGPRGPAAPPRGAPTGVPRPAGPAATR